jgi:small subunit ribosomal protein S11
MADENDTPQPEAEEAAKPAEEMTTPAAEAEVTEAPAAEAAPTTEGDKPAAEGDKPAAEGDKPAAEGDKPAAEGDKPAAEGDKPAAEGDKPAAEGDKPAAEGDKPAAEGDKPAAEGAPKGPEKKKDIFAEIDPEGEEQGKIIKKAKGSKNITQGIVHVSATFNNTIVSVTDRQGNVLGWSSSGKMGFRGSRKSTAYASQLVSQDACRQAMSHGLKEAEVRVKGPGSGRESAVRAAQNLGIDVTVIKDVTPVPHNGCRPPKARRV